MLSIFFTNCKVIGFNLTIMDLLKDIIDYVKKYPVSTTVIVGLSAYIMYYHSYYENFSEHPRYIRGMRNNLMDGRITNPTQPRSSHPRMNKRHGDIKRALTNEVIKDSASEGYSHRVRRVQNHQLMGLSLQNQIATMIAPTHNVL